MPPVRLSNATLHALPSQVRRPAYDRSGLSPAIVHIGVGAFHRAHQAVYLDDLLDTCADGAWGIVGVGLLPHDLKMRDALVPQDGLYAVIERGPGADPQPRIIGALTRVLYAPDGAEAVLETLASPETRVVSLTITEGGYYLDPKSGAPVLDHPDIVHDLAHPSRPVGTFGYLLEALARRRDRGLDPFTVQSCDNVQGNGDVTRRLMLALAEKRDPGLRDWIEAKGAFPNSMVDRITPATTDADRAMVRDAHAIEDAWPVMTEPFRQWVIEDAFCAGRPAWERVGVQMTRDVRPYETIKLRLLNAGHSAIGYLGLLAGFGHIHEVMTDDLFRRFVIGFMDEEVTPVLKGVPGIDLAGYKRTLVDRFSNPEIRDQVARICMDGSSKLPKFILPTLREQLAAGGPTGRICLVIAAWCRAMAGVDDGGTAVRIGDPIAGLLTDRARAGGRDPSPFLGITEVFGSDLPRSTVFVDQVRRALASLADIGVRQTLARIGGA